ncbi:MAG: helix-turn-helix transcriptional regulator, partial [Gammaproteobacteria bacterium]|nr:helix-turn-helix transcriptional regulator [Gammaproteobacteria bacterium]
MVTANASAQNRRAVGSLLRQWRTRRRLSQLDLALDAEISPRHLSFLETGRSQPSRDMVLRLAERLDVPLRERNELLVAAGFAPTFPERRLDDAALAAARRAMELVLKGHEPFPALAVDRYWTLVTANAAVPPLLAGIDRDLLAPPMNVLRLSLHPRGLAPRIANLREWRGHLLERLRRQVELTADEQLAALLEELRGYPAGDAAPAGRPSADLSADLGGVAVPLRLRTDDGELAFLSTTTVFGTPVDITLS